MAPPPMKLKLSTSVPNGAGASSATPSTPSIRFNLGPKQPGSATPQSAKSAKAESKKRPRASNDDGAGESSAPKKKASIKIPSVAQKKSGILKLSTSGGGLASPKTPSSATHTRLKIKGKGKPPPRPLGVGYDSEAEDAEEDPAIEENVVLRMQPGPDCDYLRQAVQNKTIGMPQAQGGADVYMRFFKHRRAAIMIRGNHYAAVLLDLPCIVESMKSWDRRGWWKSADICQILYVFAKVDSESAAEKTLIPTWIDAKTWLWPHGLTPPMHNVRKRRFRKRVSYRTIEAAEDEVQRLLALDMQCRASGGNSSAEVVDLDRLKSQEAESDDEEEEEEDEDDDDAMGEADDGFDYDDEEEEEDAEAMANRMALELGGDDDGGVLEVATPASTTGAGQAETSSAAPTPGAVETADTTETVDTPGPAGESASEDDDDEDDDDEEAEDEDNENDDEREKAQMLAQQREEVTHLQSQIDTTKAEIASTPNLFIQQRMRRRVEQLERELANKKRSIGETDEDA